MQAQVQECEGVQVQVQVSTAHHLFQHKEGEDPGEGGHTYPDEASLLTRVYHLSGGDGMVWYGYRVYMVSYGMVWYNYE